jgi:hypothetical protein
MTFKEQKTKALRNLPDRVDLERNSALPEGGKTAIEMLKARPEIRMRRWDGEASLTVRYNKIAKAGVRGPNNRMEWRDAKEEAHAYPLETQPGMEDGGLELEIFLKEKPATNRFDFALEGADNLDFSYQPALTQAQIDQKIKRPDNVIGSYAVYHKTKKNHSKGGINYATGKAFHIYRPKAIDADGNEVWAELDYKDGVLSVTVPQTFLNTAIYPVVVDPTFGYTTIGATLSFGYEDVRGSSFAAPDNGTVDSVTLYGNDGDFIGMNVTCGLYDDDASDAFIDQTAEIAWTAGNTEWRTSTFSSPPSIVSGTSYIIVGWASESGLGFYYDTGATNQGAVNTSATYATFPDPFGGTRDTNKYSIYATYTASGTEVNAERSAELHGELTANASRSAELHGEDVGTADRPAETHGTNASNAERSADLTGEASVSDERSAEGTGVRTWRIQVSVDGGAWSDVETEIQVSEVAGEYTYTHVFAFANGSEYCYRVKNVASDDSNYSNIDCETFVVATEVNAERSAELHGEDTANAERGAELHGEDTATAERGAETHGEDSASANRPAELTGADSATDERPAETHGEDTTNANRSAETTGAQDASANRSAELTGTAQASASRPAELTGEADAMAERSAEISGAFAANAERSAETSGADSASADRPVETTGVLSADAERSAELTGATSASAERSAEMDGAGIDPYCPDDSPYSPGSSKYTAKTSPYSAKENPYTNKDIYTPYPKNC